MTPGQRRLGLLAGCLLVLLATAWVAGAQAIQPGSGPAAGPDAPRPDPVRLGPEPGEPVAGYLARLPAGLPAPGTAVPALVQFGAELDEPAALAAVSGTEPAVAVLRVPLPRVQTALWFQPVRAEPGDLADPARRLELARLRAARQAAGQAAASAGRPAAVAAAEAAVLGTSCRCVLAVLVVGDRGALDVTARRNGVRAVHAAPAGTPVDGVALVPLLPEQRERANPPPDDGPIPPDDDPIPTSG